MARVSMRARLVDDRIPAAIDGLDWLMGAFGDNLAHLQLAYHVREAPLGREFYTDEQGHEHPGWLRESADAVELPGPIPSWYVAVHADYGIYVNNGTRYIPANPFWDRALLRTEREAPELLDWAARQMFVRYLGRPATGTRVLR